MAELLDSKEIVTFEDLLRSEVIQSDALSNLLYRKGIITKTELLEEMKRVKATLPKSDKGEKRMSQVTKEEAYDIARNHVGLLPYMGITDEWQGWVIYAADSLKNCWYVTFNPSLTSTTLGPSYLVAVSKKDGSILYSGSTGGD